MFFHKLSRWKWKTIRENEEKPLRRSRCEKKNRARNFCVFFVYGNWVEAFLPCLDFFFFSHRSPFELSRMCVVAESQLMSKRNENLMLSREGWSIHLAMGNFVVRYSLFPFVPLRFGFAQTESEWKAFLRFCMRSCLCYFCFPFLSLPSPATQKHFLCKQKEK